MNIKLHGTKFAMKISKSNYESLLVNKSAFCVICVNEIQYKIFKKGYDNAIMETRQTDVVFDMIL